MRVRDTCASNVVTALQADDLLSGISDSAVLSQNCTPTNCTPTLLVVVGPGSNDETVAVSPLLSSKQVSHISYNAPSAVFNQFREYPYLFRTLPTEQYEAKAIADIIESFGWSFLAVLSSGEQLHGQGKIQQLQMEVELRNNSFCFAFEDTFSRSSSQDRRDRIIMRLSQSPKAKVILLLTGKPEFDLLVAEMARAGLVNRVILTSEPWSAEVDVATVPRGIAFLGIIARPVNLARTEQFYQNVNHLLRTPQELLRLLKLRRDPFLRPFLEQELQCDLGAFSADGHLCSSFSRTTYNRTCSESDFTSIGEVRQLSILAPAILAIEVAVRAIKAVTQTNMMLNGCINFTAVRGAMRCELETMQLPCSEKYFVAGGADPTGKMCNVFTGDKAALPVYTLKNLRLNPSTNRSEFAAIAVWSDFLGNSSSDRLDWFPNATLDWGDRILSAREDTSQWPISTCSSTCQYGDRRVFENLDLAPCCWSCEACGSSAITLTTNADSCTTCELEQGLIPNANKSACVDVVPEYLQFNNGWVICMLTLSYIGAGTAVATLTIFRKNRSSPLIKACDINITSAMLVSMIIGFTLAPFIFVKPSNLVVRPRSMPHSAFSDVSHLRCPDQDEPHLSNFLEQDFR